MFSVPYKNVGLARGRQSSTSTLCVSLWDVGSTRHADMQAPAVAVTHRLHFMSVLGDWHLLPLSVKQEQHNLLACQEGNISSHSQLSM